MALTSGSFRVLLHACALGASLLASGVAAQELVADQSTTAVAFQGQVGRVATFVCPSTFTLNPRVWGTDVYSSDSAICPAARHAGVIAGGTAAQVTIRMGAAVEQLQGRERNGVTSSASPIANSTFSFIGNGEPGQINWYSTYNRVPDDFGSPITVLCPPNGDVTTSIIIGTDVYRADSAVCVAGVHAGIITVAAGGRLTVTLQPKRGPLTGSTRNGVTSSPWIGDYVSFPQPYSVIAAPVTLTVPTSAPATSTEPRLVTATTAVNPAIVAATATPVAPAPGTGTGTRVTETRPTGRQPTVLSNGPAPTGLTVRGTPTTATVQWLPVPGATGYIVNRARSGTTRWTAVTPARIAETTSPTDEFTDFSQTYTYQVLAYQADGSFGAATIDYVPAKPQDPSGLGVSAVNATSGVISWQPVDGAWEYLVSGPGLTASAQTAGTSFVVVPPPGTGVYQVASIYRPGGVLTRQRSWPSVTVSLTAGPPGVYISGTPGGAAPPAPGASTAGCACTRTGDFRNPSLRMLNQKDLRQQFTHPTAGSFTVQAQSVNGTDMLDIFDSQNRVVLSESRPSAWGWSPDNRYFALAFPPASSDAGSPVVVYRVAAGPDRWPRVINSMAYSSGRWGFSAGSKIFLIQRLQNAPIQFTFQAHNLEAPNPESAMLQRSETRVSGPSVTTSPCDDRLMYFRWDNSRTSLEGLATFYDRATFGPNTTAIDTAWDHESQTTPTASIVTGDSSSPFMVELDGLVVGGTGTSFPSLQCTP